MSATTQTASELSPRTFARWLRDAYQGRNAAKRIAADASADPRTARAWLEGASIPRATEFMRLVRENEALLAMVNDMAGRK